MDLSAFARETERRDSSHPSGRREKVPLLLLRQRVRIGRSISSVPFFVVLVVLTSNPKRALESPAGRTSASPWLCQQPAPTHFKRVSFFPFGVIPRATREAGEEGRSDVRRLRPSRPALQADGPRRDSTVSLPLTMRGCEKSASPSGSSASMLAGSVRTSAPAELASCDASNLSLASHKNSSHESRVDEIQSASHEAASSTSLMTPSQRTQSISSLGDE